jgi:hypothetical protein
MSLHSVVTAVEMAAVVELAMLASAAMSATADLHTLHTTVEFIFFFV